MFKKINKTMCKIFGHMVMDREFSCMRCDADLTVPEPKAKEPSAASIKISQLTCEVFGHSVAHRELSCMRCDADLTVSNISKNKAKG